MIKLGKDKLLAGVCGGLAEYCNIDPTIMRIIWIIGFIVSWGWSIFLYLVLSVIMADNKDNKKKNNEAN